jgi:hypothetical protein
LYYHRHFPYSLEEFYLPKYLLKNFFVDFLINHIISPKQTETAITISGQYFSAISSDLLLCLDELGTFSIIGGEKGASSF